MRVYIVEYFEHDGHRNEAVFFNLEKANKFADEKNVASTKKKSSSSGFYEVEYYDTEDEPGVSIEELISSKALDA